MAGRDDDVGSSLAAAAGLQQRLKRQEAQTANERAGFAEFMFNALQAQVTEFEKRIKPTEEVGALLASFGSVCLISIKCIGYRRPHLIFLRGIDDEEKEVELLQHVSQVNILLRAIPLKPGRTRNKIGFDTGASAPSSAT